MECRAVKETPSAILAHDSAEFDEFRPIGQTDLADFMGIRELEITADIVGKEDEASPSDEVPLMLPVGEPDR